MLQHQQPVKVGVPLWKEATDEHLRVRRQQPVDSAVALGEPLWVPWQVVVDDVAGLLEVHALGQHVGAHDNVEAVLGPSWCVGGVGTEPEQHLGLVFTARHGGDPVMERRQAREVVR